MKTNTFQTNENQWKHVATTMFQQMFISIVIVVFPLFCFGQQVKSTEMYSFDQEAQQCFKLNSFTVRCVEGKAYVMWVVVEPNANSYYILERSTDKANYEVVFAKKGTISPYNIELMYCFTDEQPLCGVSYYRLKRVRSDETTNSQELMVSYNPSNPEIKTISLAKGL